MPGYSDRERPSIATKRLENAICGTCGDSELGATGRAGLGETRHRAQGRTEEAADGIGRKMFRMDK